MAPEPRLPASAMRASIRPVPTPHHEIVEVVELDLEIVEGRTGRNGPRFGRGRDQAGVSVPLSGQAVCGLPHAACMAARPAPDFPQLVLLAERRAAAGVSFPEAGVVKGAHRARRGRRPVHAKPVRQVGHRPERLPARPLMRIPERGPEPAHGHEHGGRKPVAPPLDLGPALRIVGRGAACGADAAVVEEDVGVLVQECKRSPPCGMAPVDQYDRGLGVDKRKPRHSVVRNPFLHGKHVARLDFPPDRAVPSPVPSRPLPRASGRLYPEGGRIFGSHRLGTLVEGGPAHVRPGIPVHRVEHLGCVVLDKAPPPNHLEDRPGEPGPILGSCSPTPVRGNGGGRRLCHEDHRHGAPELGRHPFQVAQADVRLHGGPSAHALGIQARLRRKLVDLPAFALHHPP